MGTASPTLALSVVGQVRAGESTTAGLTIGLSPVSVPNSDLNAYIVWGTAPTFGGNNGDLIYVPRTSTPADHRFYAGSGTATEKMRIYSGGDISFRDSSANEAFYWDASAASLGIGGVPNVITNYSTLTTNGTSGSGLFCKVGGTNAGWFYSYADGSKISEQRALPIIIETSGTEAMRIDSSRNVGIGTSAPISKLNINGGTGDTTANDTILSLTRTSSTSNVLSGKIVLTAPSTYQQNLNFRLKTTASSAEDPSYYTDIMRVTAAGLCFGSDTAAANALDDYEEGTWTPVSNSAGYTISSSDGIYTKIGRQVTIRGGLQFSAVDASNTSLFIFIGLPFAPSNSYQGVCRENTAAGSMFMAQVTPTPEGILNSMDGVATGSNATFAINRAYIFTVTYFV